MFRTTGARRICFHFHVADIGNIAMFGPTGSGKTTLLLFLLAQAEKLGVTTVFFDKDRGGEILSRALGGTYLVLPSGQPTGMAPLRALSDTPEDRDFLIGWVTHLIRAGGYGVLPDDRRRIAQVFCTLLRLPPHYLVSLVAACFPRAAERCRRRCVSGTLVCQRGPRLGV